MGDRRKRRRAKPIRWPRLIRSTTNWKMSFCRLYYAKPEAYTEIRRSAIALNGSFFHTQRMVLQYVRNAYNGVEP